MTLAVLLDPIGQVTKTPVFDLGDGAAAGLDQGFHCVVEGFSLLRGNILPRDDNVLVERHGFLLPLGGRRVRRRKVRRLRWISMRRPGCSRALWCSAEETALREEAG